GARLAVTFRIANGPRRITRRRLPAWSIWRNLFRSFRRTAYLSGKWVRAEHPRKSAVRSRLGKNASANEKNPAHRAATRRHRRASLLGVSRSRRAHGDGRRHSGGGFPLDR